ncbi:hypothetical protein Goklo_008146 [Gossypium klotzschianum]|uniref:Uncharacterized protein n=1 Tax=Gossypium klotzschianum TaxID=34286 RepID=A0A7J8UZ62_9ROSI|nr:hypothetical protein [Gossypium klotzschianum]
MIALNGRNPINTRSKLIVTLLRRVNQDGQPLRLLLGTAKGRLWIAVQTYSARAVEAKAVQMGTKLTSACFGNQDQGKMIAATGDTLQDNGTVCKSVTVKIVDHCLSYPSIINLSRETFTIIVNPVAGIINVEYK